VIAPAELPRLPRVWRVELRATESPWPWGRWEATVTHGIGITREGFPWRARSRGGLLAKVAREAARHAAEAGETTIHIEIEELSQLPRPSDVGRRLVSIAGL